MEITATFVSEPKTVMRSYRACHRGLYTAQWVIYVAVSGTGVLLSAPLLVGMGVVGLAAQEIFIRLQLRPYLSGPRTITMTMTDLEYRVLIAPDRTTSRSWSTFTKVFRSGDFWVLRVSRAMAMALPTSALSPEQTAIFLDAMRSKGLFRD
jgi:hypothetical protein